MWKISEEAIRLMRNGASTTVAYRAWQRSNLSSRSCVLFEANRRGKLFGMASNPPIGRTEARKLADQTVAGLDNYYHCAVPTRWRPLFARTFIKAAVFAAHTARPLSVRTI